MCDPPKSARWFLFIAACPTFIQLHHTKLELMAGKYIESAKAVRLANSYFQSRRLRRRRVDYPQRPCSSSPLLSDAESMACSRGNTSRSQARSEERRVAKD